MRRPLGVAGPRTSWTGQALVEFAFAILVFLVLLMAIFDFGRGIYMYNGVSQAAREIARAASVNQQATGGGFSPEAQVVVNVQKGLVPGLVVDNPACVASTASSDTGAPTNRRCNESEYIVVTAHSTYKPVSLLGFLGTINLQAKGRIQIPLSQNK
jgi:Flp pilus assembly protein TadG